MIAESGRDLIVISVDLCGKSSPSATFMLSTCHHLAQRGAVASILHPPDTRVSRLLLLPRTEWTDQPALPLSLNAPPLRSFACCSLGWTLDRVP